MKSKQILGFVLAACIALGVTACANSAVNSNNASDNQNSESAKTEYKWDFKKKNGDIEELKAECDQKGTVTEITYETPAYAVNDLLGLDETIEKKATVYLPYGYDENTQYDVLYLLHGTEGDGDGPMEEFWLVQWGDQTTHVLDNMIKNGLCKPMIVVCPTYYSRVEGHELGDAEAKALADKTGDSFIHTETAEDGGTVDNAQNIWPVYFGQELRNNLIPAVESEYLTFANKDVSEAGLIGSRDHRAIAGLSRGSMTVARSGLTQNADLFSWYGNFSGIWEDFDDLKTAMTDTFKDYDIKFWFNGNGKADFAKDNHEQFRDQVLSELSDKFTDGENYAFVSLRDGGHFYLSWIVDLYNMLLVTFQE